MAAGDKYIGIRSGKAIVVSFNSVRNRKTLVNALCDCGVIFVCSGANMKSGNTSSCGCYRDETRANGGIVTHGHSIAEKGSRKPTKTYRSWMAMRRRCLYDKHPAFNHYGGRGITVCESWALFENFLADMGERPPRMTLDRKDPDGHYTKANCRWANSKTQASNRRNSVSSPGLACLIGRMRADGVRMEIIAKRTNVAVRVAYWMMKNMAGK